MRINILLLLLISLLLFSSNCKQNNAKNTTTYKQLILDSTSVQIKNFSISFSFQKENLKFVTGNFTHKTKSYGKKLLVLDSNDTIIYESKDFGEYYLFKPYFYKIETSGKMYILCLSSYEYYCETEVFLLENNKINHIGSIQFTGKTMETNVIDILHIFEKDRTTYFTFKSDSLVYFPCIIDTLIENKNTFYTYDKHSKFRFNSN